MLNTCTPLERLSTSGFPEEGGGGRRLKLQIDWRITRLNKRELSYHDLKQDFPFVISCYV